MDILNEYQIYVIFGLVALVIVLVVLISIIFSKVKKISKMRPAEAKKYVTRATVPDWDNVKYEVMYDLLWQKFYGNKDLGQKLLATGNREIVKLNSAGDIYWGVCKIDGSYVGENNIGKILMEIRGKLQNLKQFDNL